MRPFERGREVVFSGFPHGIADLLVLGISGTQRVGPDRLCSHHSQHTARWLPWSSAKARTKSNCRGHREVLTEARARGSNCDGRTRSGLSDRMRYVRQVDSVGDRKLEY